MAFSESVTLVSVTAGTTFASTDLYKFVVLDGGTVVVPNTTGNVLPFGVLYGITATTSTDANAVPVAIDGIAKVRMAASTLAAGDHIGSSTAGLGIAPSTDGYVAGVIVSGSSGSANRIASVKLFTGPLSTP
jgi:hypothetical protein